MSPETIYSLPLEIKALFDEALQDAKRSDSRGGEKITEEELDDIATRFNLNKKDIIDYTKGGLSCFRDEIGLSATKTGAIVEIETGKGREQLTPREKQLFTYFGLASPEEQNIIKNAIFNYAKDSGLGGLEVFNLADTKIIFKVT